VGIRLGSLSVLLHVISNSKNYFWGDINVMPHAYMHNNIVENKNKSNYKGVAAQCKQFPHYTPKKPP